MVRSSAFNSFYYSGTGQIINHRPLIEHYNLDPDKHRQLAALQMAYPRLLPPYGYSDDSDAEDHGLEREQSETTAILANLQPGCNRYFLSSCIDILQWWCPMFQMSLRKPHRSHLDAQLAFVFCIILFLLFVFSCV